MDTQHSENPQKQKILDHYRRLCSMREYCASEVMTKVTKALEGDSRTAAEIVASLIEDKYVDDRRYAEAFARDKAAIAGWGAVKIRFMLQAKGVSRDLIDAALGEIDDARSGQRLEKLAAVKFKTLREDPQCRLKMLRYLLGRGYRYEEAAPVVEALIKGTQD